MATFTGLIGGSCSGKARRCDPDGYTMDADSFGLLKGHAYGILDCRLLKGGSVTARLIRIRNPWGFREVATAPAANSLLCPTTDGHICSMLCDGSACAHRYPMRNIWVNWAKHLTVARILWQWEGAWSDNSVEWSQQMGDGQTALTALNCTLPSDAPYAAGDDGTFWMDVQVSKHAYTRKPKVFCPPLQPKLTYIGVMCTAGFHPAV